MASKYEQYVGTRFGTRVVILLNKNRKFLMKCDCGEQSYVNPQHIVGGFATKCFKCSVKNSPWKDPIDR